MGSALDLSEDNTGIMGITFGYSMDMAYPAVFVDEKGYHWVIIERGTEQSRDTTRDIDELLYLVFQFIVRTLASKYGMTNRVPGQDQRRPMFHEQIRLMGLVSPTFAARTKKEIDETLAKYPYSDETSVV
ncbi:unnamed protein product [Didymodactylos carnosus]|uniref:Immunity protein 63 domain-containing protein n=1 Tax=Didymodactylos carnosus TaxID=1234261 RepID=A0A814LW23_9BILA|nr:unnamed protein product [Didymodactylos carnosus]CAF1281392.1 unnamed protein product [Didymodactylos carnosus]CAF3837161.1 unnamed protein product [Didymodactylos carnosus]CAF4086187.1 unnamed protein product [Didymodactylos carnosus]